MTEPAVPNENNVSRQNVESLLEKSYQPETPPADFAHRVESMMQMAATSAAAQRRQTQSSLEYLDAMYAPKPLPRALRLSRRWVLAIAGIAAAIVLTVIIIDMVDRLHVPASVPTVVVRSTPAGSGQVATPKDATPTPAASVAAGGLLPRPRAKVAGDLAALGQTIETKSHEKRRLQLADGSTLYMNQNSAVRIDAPRQVTLSSGEIFVEVAPRDASGPQSTFMVRTPNRQVTALGTKFAVRVEDKQTNVLVTQGKVAVSGFGELLGASRQLSCGRDDNRLSIVQRPMRQLDWVSELLDGALTPLVPPAGHDGGQLVALGPDGKEMSLALRRYHVDVFIQDGFARTTIDQTYFNGENSRLEGTFYFPLPPDASLSRLAMYVDGKLMEGGMAERDHARATYESIVTRQKDPALLEWLDGSTFKMRVFPLEARQEKRIILSYTQRLENVAGQTDYRFPAGHSLGSVKDWTFHALVRGGAETAWSSPTHALTATQLAGDLVLDDRRQDARLDGDVVVRFYDAKTAAAAGPRFSTATHEGAKYLMLRQRIDLPAGVRKAQRDWVFLFETSGDRDPLLARAQIDVIRSMLANVEHDDRFTIISAGTRVETFASQLLPATTANVAAAVEFMEHSHLVGALDLEQALASAKPFLEGAADACLVHVGSGTAVLGERRDDALLTQLPPSAHYVGIGVGKRWARNFMRAAAAKTGGFFTQINPDENIPWRAMDVLATLNSPRLMNIEVSAQVGNETLPMLTFADALTSGQELAAVGRFDAAKPLPTTITVKGVVDGKPYMQTLEVASAADGADYLPRTWAKLRIDEMLSKDAAANHDAIVKLSKEMYVMSPFTSLLVLENEEMYKQYNVDRGRKDHWAMYPAPTTMPVVTEPITEPIGLTPWPASTPTTGPVKKPSPGEVLNRIIIRTPAELLYWPGEVWVPDGGTLYVGGQKVSVDSNGRFWWRDSNGAMQSGDAMLEWQKQNVDARESEIPWKELVRLPANWREISRRDGRYGWDNLNGFSYGIKSTTYSTWGKSGILQRGGVPQTRHVWNGLTSRGEHEARLSEVVIAGARDPGRALDLRAWNHATDGAAVLRTDGTVAFFRDRRSGQTDYIADDIYVGERRDLPTFAGRLPVSSISGEGYTRLAKSPNQGIFSDLLSHAPGMNTSRADIAAVLATESSLADERRVGRIDPAAGKLLAASRMPNWREAVLTSSDGQTMTAVFDGAGKLRYERLIEGCLRETVLCDGKAIWSLYPELGVGAKRNVSRFHNAEFESVLPLLVPAAEDLVDGCDVLLLDGHTVAVVPFAQKNGPTTQPTATAVQMQIVFNDAGQLVEKRWVEGPYGQPASLEKGKLLRRQLFAADGTITDLDSNGKVVATAKVAIKPATAPDFTVAPNLVIVPMLDLMNVANRPISDEIVSGLTAPQGKQLLATCLADGDHRPGLFVLVAANQAGGWSGEKIKVTKASVEKEISLDPAQIADSPVCQYLSAVMAADQNKTPLKVATPLGDGLLSRLADLYAIEHPAPADAKADTNAVRQARVEQIKSYVQKAGPTAFGWAAAMIACNEFGDYEGHKLVELLDKTPHPADWQRYELAAAKAPSDTRESARRFLALSRDRLARGDVPMYGQCLINVLASVPADMNAPLPSTIPATQAVPPGASPATSPISPASSETAWQALVRESAEHYVATGRRDMLVVMARQIAQRDNSITSDELIRMALADAPDDQRLPLTLLAVECCSQLGSQARASALLDDLLSRKEFAQQAALWKLAASFAQKQGHLAQACRQIQQALDLEFAQTKDEYDIESIRADYGSLLERYRVLAQAIGTSESAMPKDLAAKVIQTADRWRMLDDDPSAACNAASTALAAMGETDLAWEYLTTPLSVHPGESAAWTKLAAELSGQGQFDLATRAYATAFGFESTNAQILWDWASTSQQAGKPEQARKLYQQLAQGTWQPRFAWLKARAEQMTKN